MMMTTLIKRLSGLALAASLVGCANSYVVLLPNPDGTTGKVIVTGKKGQQVIDQVSAAVPLDGSKAPEAISGDKIQRDFGAAIAARPLIPERFLLYFKSGGADLTAESAALLPKVLKAVSLRPAVDVSVIGHTDTVGDKEYNRSLSLERAQFVANLLRKQGLKVHALTVESHGERNPLVKTPDNTAEPRNRRVEISIR